jgi:hypothetical protein
MIVDWREWIERYVHEVVRRLPRDRREEVADDLRARLTTEVETRLDGSDRTAEKIAPSDCLRWDPAGRLRAGSDQTVLIGRASCRSSGSARPECFSSTSRSPRCG